MYVKGTKKCFNKRPEEHIQTLVAEISSDKVRSHLRPPSLSSWNCKYVGGRRLLVPEMSADRKKTVNFVISDNKIGVIGALNKHLKKRRAAGRLRGLFHRSCCSARISTSPTCLLALRADSKLIDGFIRCGFVQLPQEMKSRVWTAFIWTTLDLCCTANLRKKQDYSMNGPAGAEPSDLWSSSQPRASAPGLYCMCSAASRRWRTGDDEMRKCVWWFACACIHWNMRMNRWRGGEREVVLALRR